MQENKEKIADVVKKGRLAKGYTQLQLAELTRISLRSIQRIENGEVNARMYTLKILADHLGFEIESVVETPVTSMNSNGATGDHKIQKIFFSSGIGLLMLLLGGAFLSQAPVFPETTFELFTFWAGVTAFYLIILWWIWKPAPVLRFGFSRHK